MATTEKNKTTPDIPNRALRNLIIRALLLEGNKPEKLAASFDLDVATVKKYGHPKSEVATRKAFDLAVTEDSKTTLKEANHDRMIREAKMLWRGSRLTRSAIAKRLGCCVRTLERAGVFKEVEFD
ncbi:hypothetical protein [Shewanella chilikensis]|uniref:hypothetical protein n=1 Tax=Shewanella chilikensis TaxID=558541 RepID=UPI00399989AB